MPITSKFDYLKALRGVDLSPAQYRVLVSILNYADRDGTNAWPSVNTLAADASVDRRTVQRATEALAELGWLKKVSRGGNEVRFRETNVYELTLPTGGATVLPIGGQGDRKGGTDAGRAARMSDKGGADVRQGRRDAAELDPSPEPLHQIPDRSARMRPRPVVDPGAASPTRGPAMPLEGWEMARRDLDYCLDWLAEEVGGLDGIEESTAEGMWEAGAHPKAIYFKIEKDRRVA